MNAPAGFQPARDAQASMAEHLRQEAEQGPDPVHTEPARKQTQIIAIYG